MDIALVFDYNGTLIKDIGPEILAECARRTGIEKRILKNLLKPNPKLARSFPQRDTKLCLKIAHDIAINALPLKKINELFSRINDAKVTAFISSHAPSETIEEWLAKNGFHDIVSLCYGRDEGSKKEHLKRILRFDDYKRVVYFADAPKDFEGINSNKLLLQIAINPHTGKKYPKNVDKILFQKLSWGLIESLNLGI